MKRIYFLLVIGVLLGLNSCKKDARTDPAICAKIWSDEVADELAAVNNAGLAYLDDPTHETCIAYKNAYQAYLDALEPFLECASYTPQQKTALRDAFDQAEASLETLCDD